MSIGGGCNQINLTFANNSTFANVGIAMMEAMAIPSACTKQNKEMNQTTITVVKDKTIPGALVTNTMNTWTITTTTTTMIMMSHLLPVLIQTKL